MNTLELADVILDLFSRRSSPNVDEIMRESLTDKVFLSNKSAIEEKLSSLGLQKAHGAVASGTGIASEISDATPAEVRSAVKLLKVRNKIHQCGRGRGNCVVIIDNTPLGSKAAQAEPAKEKSGSFISDFVPPPGAEAPDFATLQEARVAYANLTVTNDHLRRQNRILHQTIDDMTVENDRLKNALNEQ